MAALNTPSTFFDITNIAKLNRNAAYKLKNGSPKFKDVFRARCRAKLKENREKFINKLRKISLNDDVQIVLSAIGVLEPDGLQPPWDPDSDDELTQEEEQIISEYEAMLTREENMFAELLEKSLEEVVCPVCEKMALIKEDLTPYQSYIVCHRCNIRIPTEASLQDIRLHLESCLNHHSSMCGGQQEFHLIPEDDSIHIYMLCSHCSYMNIII